MKKFILSIFVVFILLACATPMVIAECIELYDKSGRFVRLECDESQTTNPSSSTVKSEPPCVVKTSLERGRQDVSPATTELRVVFDQPMNPRGYSVVRVGPNFPKIIDRPSWADDRTFVLRIQLEPDHEYELSFNSEEFHNFRNVRGEPATPFLLHFRTAPGPGDKMTSKQNQEGELVVDSSPQGAKVFLDRQEVGYTPLRLSNIKPGLRFLLLAKEGYKPYQQVFEHPKGTKKEIFANLLEDTQSEKPNLRDAQEKKQNPLGNFLRDFTTNLNILNAGYEIQCYKAIKEREQRGLIGPEEAKYLIEKECKRQDRGQAQQGYTCPICGDIGTPQVGFKGAYFTCPNGHSWK